MLISFHLTGCLLLKNKAMWLGLETSRAGSSQARSSLRLGSFRKRAENHAWLGLKSGLSWLVSLASSRAELVTILWQERAGRMVTVQWMPRRPHGEWGGERSRLADGDVDAKETARWTGRWKKVADDRRCGCRGDCTANGGWGGERRTARRRRGRHWGNGGGDTPSIGIAWTKPPPVAPMWLCLSTL